MKTYNIVSIDEFKTNIQRNSRLLGIDHGNKNIGFAICDENKKVATPLKSMQKTKFLNLISDIKEIIKDEDYPITADHILVLRNAGPKGGPGMPEWGMIPMPKALLKQGHRDMIRLSDARMSGTSYGACILHVAPEAFIGGPLALIKTGDIIRVDIPNRKLEVDVSESEMKKRKKEWVEPKPRYERGYGYIYSKHIEQADKGCDFDFLSTDFGAAVEEPEIN